MKASIVVILLMLSVFSYAGTEELFVVETKSEFEKTPMLVYVGKTTLGTVFFRVYYREVDPSWGESSISINLHNSESGENFSGELQKKRVANAEDIWMVSFSITDNYLKYGSLEVSRMRSSKYMTEILIHCFHLNDLYNWNSEFDSTDVIMRGEDERFNALRKRKSSYYEGWSKGIGTKWGKGYGKGSEE